VDDRLASNEFSRAIDDEKAHLNFGGGDSPGTNEIAIIDPSINLILRITSDYLLLADSTTPGTGFGSPIPV
jgi:hypothetical protein